MKPTRRDALTLIEILMATAILSLALVPIADLILKNSRQTRHSAERLGAAMAARSVLERYRVMRPVALSQQFPLTGKTIDPAADPVLALPGTTKSAAQPYLETLTEDELKSYQERSARFPVQLAFRPEPDGRSGRLVATVTWEAVNGNKDATLVASEWIDERN